MTTTIPNTPTITTKKRARMRVAAQCFTRTLFALFLVIGLTPAVALADTAAHTNPVQQTESDDSFNSHAPTESIQSPEDESSSASAQVSELLSLVNSNTSPDSESTSDLVELATSSIKDNPNINVGPYVLELTQDSAGAKFYQWGSADPVEYTGTITLRSANGNTHIVVKGSHNIVLGEEEMGNTITNPGANNAAIDFQPATGSSTSRSTLTIADGSTNILKGGNGAPAINIANGVTLTIDGGGTLEATGSDYCSAIGVSGIGNDRFGDLNLNHTGTITAKGGTSAPALGDPNPDQSLATGSTIFHSGTTTLTAGSNFANDLMAGFIQVYGGNIHLSHKQPVMYQGYAEDEFEDVEVVGLKISGLPAGSKLTQLPFNIDSTTLPAGYFCLDYNPRLGGYVVNGFDAIEANESIGIFLARSLARDGSVLSVQANGATYEGMLVASGATGGYDVNLASRESLTDKDPVINVGDLYNNVIFRDQKQYSVDGGASWRFYEGAATLTGTNTLTNVYFQNGTHEVNLRDLTLTETTFYLENSANVNLMLVGTNAISTKGADPAIAIRGNRVSLTISGKGSLNASTTASAPAIGSATNAACDNATITIKSGTIVASSAGGPGIGSGDVDSTQGRSTLGTISIQGGSIKAYGNTNDVLRSDISSAIGSGPAFDSRVNKISITGGNVTAISYAGAGIGSSTRGTVGDINISGGTITARSDSNLGMPGIGGSKNINQWGSCDSVTISGGSITVSGGTVTSMTSTIRVDAISSAKTTITGGTINGQAAKTQPKVKAMAEVDDSVMALSLAEDESDTKVQTLAEDTTDAQIDGDDNSDEYEPVSADEVVDNPVNEEGEDLVPVVFTGLPANTSLSSVDFSIVNIDLVDDPTKSDDYGVRDVTTSPEGTLTFYLTYGEAYRRLVLASCDGKMYAGSIVSGENDVLTCALKETDALLFYEGHTFEGGWQCEDDGIAWSTDGASTETKNGGNLTALCFETPLAGVTVHYATNNGAGFGSWAEDGDIAGEMEEPIQSLRVSLAGDAAKGRSVEYRMLLSDGNWTPWVSDGEETAITEGAVAKAVQAKIVQAQTAPDDQLAQIVGGSASSQPSTNADMLAKTGDTFAMNAISAFICAMLAATILAISLRTKRKHSRQ